MRLVAKPSRARVTVGALCFAAAGCNRVLGIDAPYDRTDGSPEVMIPSETGGKAETSGGAEIGRDASLPDSEAPTGSALGDSSDVPDQFIEADSVLGDSSDVRTEAQVGPLGPTEPEAGSPQPADAAAAPCGSIGQRCCASGDCPGGLNLLCNGPTAGRCISPWPSWRMPNPSSAGLPNPADYDTSSAGVVVDRVTRLMWQRAVDTIFDWVGAQQHCTDLRLGGYDDWRLPSRIELVTIVDFTKRIPAFDTTVFANQIGDWTWTSSPIAGAPGYAWYVDFGTGEASWSTFGSYFYDVRCVRLSASPGDGGALSSPRYIASNGTVEDPVTGLVWQQVIDGLGRTFAEAQAYCSTLALAGGGFRVPSLNELQTIVDDVRTDPAIDPVAFPDTPGTTPFWTSSLLADLTSRAHSVMFGYGMYSGSASNNPIDYLNLVRCVR